jgi:hypothetical protein
MKTRSIVVMGAAVLLVLAGSLLLLSPRGPAQPLRPRFIGFTYRPPTAFTKALPPHFASTIREWLASGTNVALFAITNTQRRSILLSPYVGFYNSTNATLTLYYTVLLNTPDAYGVCLRPGQATTVEVPVLPVFGSGVLQFGWTPDYKHFLPRTFEQTRRWVNGKPADFRGTFVYSELIAPPP